LIRGWVWSCKDVTVSWLRCRPGDLRLEVTCSPKTPGRGREIANARCRKPRTPGQGSREHPAQDTENTRSGAESVKKEIENGETRKERDRARIGAGRVASRERGKERDRARIGAMFT